MAYEFDDVAVVYTDKIEAQQEKCKSNLGRLDDLRGKYHGDIKVLFRVLKITTALRPSEFDDVVMRHHYRTDTDENIS